MIGAKDFVDVTPAGARGARIGLAHGGGGQLTDELIATSVLPRLDNPVLGELLDAAMMRNEGGRLSLTIDGYVVQPLQFPGGDIGRLAISGTVNDLAMCGAEPVGIAMGMILAEGLERSTLEAVLDSVRATAEEAGVRVVTGDTKVVGRGQADGMYLTTAGVGLVRGASPHPDRVKPGDAIVINGPIADHGLAVMLAREMPQVTSVLKSDVAPLNRLIRRLLVRVPGISFLRDPTRGGLAGQAPHLARRTGLHVSLDEAAIPVRPETLHAAEMLGLDPLDVANEGKVVIVVPECDADDVMSVLNSDPRGEGAAVIGRVESTPDGICDLRTRLGGRRIVQKPYGEQLPRIC
jgi:hydrogenase expression/formation protein HypE